jgi:hypothetical protein
LTLDPRLDPDRCEIGRLSNTQFRAILDDAAAEFQALRYMKRRRRKSKGRATPDTDFAPAPTNTDTLLDELR